MEHETRSMNNAHSFNSKLRRRDLLHGLGVMAFIEAVPAWAKFGGLKIGVCASSRDLNKDVQYGFDYLEPGAAEIADMSKDAFEAFKAQVLASPIRCETCNSFVRKLRVVGNDVHEDELKVYLTSTLDRCRQLGGKIVVWGSAGSRNVPDGYSRDLAWRQIKRFLQLAGDTARPNGIVIAIEPLRRQESNIINSGREALELVRDTGHPNVKMIIDYYHLRVENEDPQIVWTARNEIVHFHFANPNGRVWPRSLDEDSEYPRFFQMVKKINYQGRISIEGSGTFEQDAKTSLKFFSQELA